MLIITPSIIHLASIPKVTENDYKLFLSTVEKNCNSEYIYAGPFMPQFYLMTKKNNPTKFDVILTGHTTNNQLINAKKDILEKEPDCLILNYQYVKKFKYNKNNPLDIYLEKNYYEFASLENSTTKLYKSKIK